MRLRRRQSRPVASRFRAITAIELVEEVDETRLESEARGRLNDCPCRRSLHKLLFATGLGGCERDVRDCRRTGERLRVATASSRTSRTSIFYAQESSTTLRPLATAFLGFAFAASAAFRGARHVQHRSGSYLSELRSRSHGRSVGVARQVSRRAPARSPRQGSADRHRRHQDRHDIDRFRSRETECARQERRNVRRREVSDRDVHAASSSTSRTVRRRRVDGTLDLHGVKKPVKLTVNKFLCKPHPMRKDRKCAAPMRRARSIAKTSASLTARPQAST